MLTNSNDIYLEYTRKRKFVKRKMVPFFETQCILTIAD